MAFTPVEEQNLKNLLTKYAELLDLGANASEIIGELAASNVTVVDLPLADPLQPDDVLYVAQNLGDKQAQFSQIATYVQSLLVTPMSRGKTFFMGQR